VLCGFEWSVRKLIRQGKLAEASRLLRDRMSKDARPRSRYLNYLGVCEGRMGHLERARELFLRAHSLSPRDPKPLNNLGNLAYLQRDLDSARQYYMRALREDAWATEPRFNLALLYQDLGHSEKVLSSYEGYVITKRAIQWGKAAAITVLVLLLIIIVSL